MRVKLFAGAAALLLSILVAGACYAQQPVLAVDIPFAFHAGNQMLPAGAYRVETVLTSSGCLRRLRQVNGDVLAVFPTMSIESKKGVVPEPELIFNRYGENYFLSQIWTGDSVGRELLKSRHEKEIARDLEKGEIALVLHRIDVKS